MRICVGCGMCIWGNMCSVWHMYVMYVNLKVWCVCGMWTMYMWCVYRCMHKYAYRYVYVGVCVGMCVFVCVCDIGICF